MEFLKKIDDFFFDAIFQRFAHWFQRLTGKDNFFLGYTSFLIMVMAQGYVLCMLSQKHDELVAAIIGSIIILICGNMYLRHGEKSIRKENGSSRFMNRLRLSPLMISLRLYLAFRILVTIIFFIAERDDRYYLQLIYLQIFVSILYFGACTPLPPSDSSISRWINALRTSLKRMAPAPEGA